MNFSDLDLNPAIVKALSSQDITETSDIQAQSIPHILKGQDVIAKAQTGSGKTIAFGAGIIHRVRSRHQAPQALILCPTRELAQQVAGELKKLALFVDNLKVLVICGGMPIGPQINSLEHGTDIVVGTPGRIMDLERKAKLDLSAVEMLVLDEADRMLDMGFISAIETIADRCPRDKQTLFFSATFAPQIEALSRRFQNNPITVEAHAIETPVSIDERYLDVMQSDPADILINLLSQEQPESAIIFCNTIATTKSVNKVLYQNGFLALALHGDLEQRQRDEILVRFANKSTQVLVATDVAARGLDIDDVDLVINYELSRDLSTHTHRVGRTGRAGKLGSAITFVQHPRQLEKLQSKRGNIDLEQPIAHSNGPMPRLPDYVTIAIGAGKKNKLRKGDLLGALTGDGNFNANIIGKIESQAFQTYVAIERSSANRVLAFLQSGKVKGRSLKSRRF